MATKEIPQNKSFEWTNLQFGRWLSSPPPGEEVVISGISGRLPESNNIYEFQEHLFNKEEMVTDDGRRWKLDHPEIPQRTAKIYDVDKFDPGFFGIHHRQTEYMDSMMRTLLETATETVMDAGINPVELEGSRTGVFISVSWSDAENLTLVNVTEPQMFSMTGYLRSMAANRISYFLKLKGPSYIVDTACSSSMNALAEAFKAIRNGQCDNAIVGAANLLIHPGNSLQFFRLGVLSGDGVCKVFDQSADGYVRGEMIGCIFLQRAKNARRIYAQVINAKVNTDGFKEHGITFPSTISQKHLMTEIYEESRVHPSELSFLEAHGTGTQVGDPQEVEAIDEALAKKRKKPLLVGSVKCSIGHTEPASGICSIAKVLIAMETGLITPNINLKKIKEGMKGMEEGRMKVVTEITKLEGEEAIIGINNFGFGGNNCHAILRRFKKQKINNSLPGDDIPRLVCVSARTEEAILGMLDDLNRKPLDNDYIGLLHQMFKYDINNHLYRGYTILSKNGPMKTSFKFFNQIKAPVYVFFGSFENRFKELGRNLLEFPVFRNTVSKINKCLNDNIDIENVILEKDKINKPLGAIAVQIGFVELLKSLELYPNAVYGDAAGKLVSAYYYNACTLEDVLLTVSKMAQQPPQIISDIHFESIWAKLNDSIKRKMQNDDLNYFETFFKTKSQLNGDSFDYECLYYPPKNSTVLNVSDQHLNNKDVLIGEQDMIQFLETLGRLYEKGHTPHLHKLYPEVQYPVSRGTPLISPLVRWNHNKTWHIYKFDQFTISDAEQMEYNISFLHDEFKFIGGHVIDGRNLFPATQYLNLVWQTYAQSRRKLIMDTPVVFENCKFIRAVTMPKSGFVKLLVNIQQGSGNFEVLEKNSVVVSGRIYSPKDISQYQTELPPIPLLDDPTLIMEQDEIYRELYLRGYNYSDLFKGIVRCNLDSSCGLVKWENNWCTFMDKMLQMRILQGDTRLLYVPVGIKKLTIDPLKHMDFIQNKEDNVLPVHVYKECNIIKSGGIEICGLQAKSISKRKPMGEPVLEKHQFISNQAKLDLQTAVRINTQIVLENSLENNFKAVEVLDSSSENDVKYLLPLVSQMLEDVPSVNPDLTISTKATLEEIPGVKIEDFVLTPESKVLLITGTNLLQRSTLKPIFDALSHHGFVMTKEKIDFTSELIEDIEIMTEYLTEDERLILFRKKTETYSNPICLTISSQHFDWIPELQQALKQDSNVVVYSQNEKLNGILGLVNCIRREPGGSKVKCFFMMEETPEFDPQNPFYQEQLKKNLAVNIYKDSHWGTYRHLLLEDLKIVETEHCFGNTLVRGDLSSLRWVEGSLTEKTKLQEHELLVYNYYSSINFKDIMAASGRISVDVIASARTEQECVLGFEYSGKDSSGRRITGMTDRQALASLVVADSNFLWRVPDSWSLEDAATVPVVYSTVMYSLLVMINLKPGTKVLIHSATGGIGIAALNVCIYHRCEIFVTVGTQEKRDYLKKHYPQIADDHVGNSRDTSFEEMVKTVTKGRGVDVVLNSLTDDKLKASVRCLARGGHLMEIGKFDLANDTELDLLLLERGVNYHGVMLDQIFKSSEFIKAKLVKLIYDGMDAGFVKPLPRTVFEQNDLEAAYRFMTHGKHIGKVMVKMRDEEEQKDAKPTRKLFKAVSRFNCDSEKTYVIIGGLGGVGLELADWLILRNAKKLILVSSSGIRSGYQTQRIRIWKSYGVHIQISKQDITTKEGCEALIKEAKVLGPVEAIFNLAVVLKDTLFEDQNEEKFRISLAPKAYATIYLDQVTRELCPELRYFVIFSSVSCGRGNAGQTNYGMANSIMERICEQRKKDGLPALAIQWGAIGDVGLVAKMQKENKELVIGGTLQQKISSCMEVMDTFLKQENPVVASMVVAEKHSRLSGALSAVDAVASLIGIKDMKTISQHATLAELGMDSMMGTEVMQILEKEFEIYITAKDVRSLTFAKLNELEEERKNTLEEKTVSKTSKGTDVLLQDIPDSKTSEVPIIRLVSSVKPEDEAMTVFVLPGIEGVFKPLESFIKNIKAHVLGLQYSYRNPQNSVEETAKALLPHFEKELTGKTFHLIGYSFGVVVALELVNMLEEKGYKGNVIFIDGSPAYLKASAKEYLPGETDPEIETILLQKILRVLLPIDVLEHSQEKFLKCGSFDERMNFALSLVPLDVAHLQKLEKQAAITLYTRFKSVLKYKFSHEKIKSSVHLFKARFPMVNTMDEQYMLSEVCENPVTVSVLDGDHLTILNDQNLVETVNKWLH